MDTKEYIIVICMWMTSSKWRLGITAFVTKWAKSTKKSHFTQLPNSRALIYQLLVWRLWSLGHWRVNSDDIDGACPIASRSRFAGEDARGGPHSRSRRHRWFWAAMEVDVGASGKRLLSAFLCLLAASLAAPSAALLRPPSPFLGISPHGPIFTSRFYNM